MAMTDSTSVCNRMIPIRGLQGRTGERSTSKTLELYGSRPRAATGADFRLTASSLNQTYRAKGIHND